MCITLATVGKSGNVEIVVEQIILKPSILLKVVALFSNLVWRGDDLLCIQQRLEGNKQQMRLGKQQLRTEYTK